MWKYLIQDLLGTVKYAPGGILMGSLVYILLVWFRKKRGSTEKEAFSFVEMLFCVYVAIVVVITFLSRDGGIGGKLDLQIGSSLGINVRNDAYIAENVLLFIPYGFLLGVVWKKERRFLNHLSLGLLTSFGIECLQLVGGRGIFQTDDIITNTIGSVVGYLIYYLFIGWRRKKKDA